MRPFDKYRRKQGNMTGTSDEIAILASQCMRLGNAECAEAIELNIAAAVASGRWEEMNKWHRVRLRARRMLQEESLTLDLAAVVAERDKGAVGLRPA
jgi:hypothetical protein